MGFPLVVGAKSVSSRLIASAEPVDEFADDGVRVLRPSVPSTATIFVVNSPDHQQMAIITLSYYDMMCEERNEREYSIAELRLQIARSTDATTMDSRDLIHRIRLPNRTNDLEQRVVPTQVQATRMAVFSQDLRFLACLVPHPRGVDSTVVVFQIRKAKESTVRSQPPLPSYIPTSSVPLDVSALVATNPRVLVQHKNEKTGEVDPLLNVTSLANCGSSLLVLGTFDGCILLASYRPLLLLDTLHQCVADEKALPIEISAIDTLIDRNDSKKGRLAVVMGKHTIITFDSCINDTVHPDDKNGLVESSSVMDSSRTIQTVQLTETHRIRPNDEASTSSFAYIKWIADPYLAVLHSPDASCVTSVFALYDNGCNAPVYTTIMSAGRLEEHSMTDFAVNVANQALTNGHHHEPTFKAGEVYDSTLDYDRVTDCLVISSFLVNTSTKQHHPFIYLWNWRANSQSFSAKAVVRVEMKSVCISSAFFARDETNRRKLVHVIASAPTAYDQIQLRKEGYDLAVLSPPNQVACCGGRLQEASSLLLGTTTISYPRRFRTSAQENYEVQWAESSVPNSYVSTHGTPVIAAVGSFYGRNVAVASSRGLCALSGLGCDRRHPGISSLHHDGLSKCNGVHENAPHHHSLLPKGFTFPRWHLFGNETDERAFKVVAMKWWEGGNLNSELVPSARFTDDLLVAVIKVLDEDKYYLSCWTCRSIEQSRQILCRLPTRKTVACSDVWGAPFPSEFVPASLDILACPVSVSERSAFDPLPRKACILVADSSHSTCYQIYQLQTVDASSDDTSDLNRYVVYARLSSSGMIGTPAQLFLASSSYAFDISGGSSIDDYDKASAEVVGVIRMHGGGLDAISVQASCIVAVGQVIEAVSDDFESFSESEVSRLWLSDITPDRIFADDGARADFFVWVVQLASGRLVSWSVPFARSPSEVFLMVEPTQTLNYGEATVGIYTVHPKGISLGIVCPAGTTASWMLHSTSGTRDDFLAGHVPKSEFGFAIGVAQSRKKLHRSTGSDFEQELFRNDCFDHEIYRASDFMLYPPGCLPSMFSLLLGTLTESNLHLSPFGRCVYRRMGVRATQTTTIMSLQLMIIRAVEKFAAISKQRNEEISLKRSLVADMLGNLTDTVRFSTTSLQFATLYLKVARQLEPSCLPFLFPILSSSRAMQRETTDDLFSTSLEFGSMGMSVAALPLLEDGDVTKSMCVAIFRYCLNAMDAGFGRDAMEFAFSSEERNTLVDVFRYSLKLTDSDDSASNDEDLAPTRGYSMMCGVSNMFSRTVETKKEDVKPLLVHRGHASITTKKKLGLYNVVALSTWQDYNKCNFSSVVSVVSRFILSSIFDGQGHMHQICWRKIGALGILLIGDSRTDFQYCTPKEFSSLAQSTPSSRFGALIPNDSGRTGRIATFLRACIQHCDNSLDAKLAGNVLDLLLILLSGDTGDFHSDIPGLLLVAVVVAHISGRISDVSNGDDEQSALWHSYRNGLKRRSSLD